MLRIIDTHVHLDHPRLQGDIPGVIAEAKRAGVVRMINIGHDFASSRESVALAKQHPEVWAVVGIHPHSAKDWRGDTLACLENWLKEPRVVAIGEIGLDYHYDFSPRPVQQEVFRKQLELAQKLKLPVVIHLREAAQETLNILQEFSPLPRGGVMHCYSGSVELARELVDLGLYIGLGGPVTFTNARKVKEVAAVVPLERLLLETDCPYLAPHPHRGKTNQPAWTALVAQEIAQIRGIKLEEVAKTTWQNANRLFGLEE